jgi:hypothetical protein
MKKTRKERQAFLDRLERKYKEKLALQRYRDESLVMSRQLKSLRGVRVSQLQDDADLLDIKDLHPTYS